MSMYVGRFAPTPTRPAACRLAGGRAGQLARRARACGRWLVRIEDVDTPAHRAGRRAEILRPACRTAASCPTRRRCASPSAARCYEHALARLRDAGRAYPCGCSRREIEAELAALGRPAQRGAEAVYPGTCRDGLHGKTARAWRARRCGATTLTSTGHDRRLGAQRQDVTREVGDFVLQRADGAVGLPARGRGRRRGAGHHGRRARRRPGRQHGAPDPPAAPARPAEPTLPAHAAGARCATGRSCPSRTAPPPLDVDDPLQALREAGRTLDLAAPSAPTAAVWLAQAVPAWRVRWTGG